MKVARCPTCKGPSIKEGNKLYPFCSERCHLVDLGRWLGEEYRIPEEPGSGVGSTEGIPTPEDGES